ncbi:MAG: phytoene/squalene synthase family protein [Planctomycetota bacterium]
MIAKSSSELQASFAHCHAVARRSAGSFYRGMRLTPQPKRAAIFAVYAWMRAADDLADGEAESQTPRGERLHDFRRQTEDAIDPARPMPRGPVWPALRDTVRRYGIPADYLETMIDGQRSDLEPVACHDFAALYDYCYRVASVVGLTCIRVWGDDGDPAVRRLAEYRGVALQLTNILRDVAEDAQRGRVYLPAEDLDRFGVTPDDLRDAHATESFGRLMQFQIERARSYYDMSASLERHVAPDCRATCWAIMRTYRVLLERIAQRPDRVLRRRLSLPLRTKLAVVGGAVVKRRF